LEAYSLYEVNEYIKRVIALNFDEPIWVECEINNVSNSRGNLYLDLIEKDEDSDNVIAKCQGTIWYRQYLFIKKKLAKLTDEILAAGIKVKIKVEINFSERYGFSMNILDIDPAFTFGQFEVNRQKIIDKLREKGLLNKNAEIKIPSVIQRIAVISSETAAGYQDFLTHIQENAYGYDFDIHLYQAAMQGQNTEATVTAAIASAREDGFDVIAISRVWGSKLYLASFDNYNIAFEVAASETPVLTGIGHDIDQTVTDIVANKVLKTPTAVADFIVEHNAQFEGELLYLLDLVKKEARYLMHEKETNLLRFEEIIKAAPSNAIYLKKHSLEYMENQIDNLGGRMIDRYTNGLDKLETMLSLLDPKNVLQRGYALIKQDKKYKGKKSLLDPKSDALEIEFIDGSIKVKLDK